MKTLTDFLNSVDNMYPFHMPGHKRNAEMFPALPLKRDITEITGADNLHNPRGIIKNSMEKAAALWGAKRSYYLVNGSSCGILAGICTLTKRKDKVLVPRNCHRSVFHALELNSLEPVFVMPEYNAEIGVYGSLKPETVEKALDKNPDIKLVIVLNPSYEGVISDVESITKLCHERGIPVLADEAHGAHLDLSPHFTGGAVAAGADIVVQSLHKTLPALTQTAILHVNGGYADICRLEHKLRVFESSSPSYLLMQSAENAVEAAGDVRIFDRWAGLIEKFEDDIKGLKTIKLALRKKSDSVFGFDRSKLVLTGVNGYALFDFLRTRSIEAEFATENYLLAMTGAGDTEEGFAKLAAALSEADRTLPPHTVSAFPPFALPRPACSIDRALDAESEAVPVLKACGRTAAEYLWEYPPGIPVIIPGEVIPEGFSANGRRFESDSGLLPELIKVLSL